MKNFRKAYRTIVEDRFPNELRLSFGAGDGASELVYEKVTWPDHDGNAQGLRYGENPDQEAALFRLASGSSPALADVSFVPPGLGLVTDARLIRSGKHPGKINMTDIDAALLILRYLDATSACAIIKHNNPCGVARAESLEQAFSKALAADYIAAFGGAVVLNRPCDRPTAEAISAGYVEVVAAPSYEEGSVATLEKRKNLRVVEIPNISRLAEFQSLRFLEIKSLMDGGIVVQPSFLAAPRGADDLTLAEAKAKNGDVAKVGREPTAEEMEDLLFGWFVEAGVTSNSVLYVKDGVTVAIGTGEQDRVGVARIAKDKAYRNATERLARQNHGVSYGELTSDQKGDIDSKVSETRGGLLGARMVSDAFFPFPDGLEVGLREGISAVVQPGGSVNDAAVIGACNKAGATMVFTAQRAFKH